MNAFRPRADLGFDYGEAGTSNFGADASPEPRFPKSLYLVRPLFSAYDMNPVAASAQESVPIPEGLDLDAWIVAPPKEELPVTLQDEDAGAEPKPKKSKKGKGKDTGTKSKGKKREGAADGADILAPVAETAEEKVERERVRILIRISTQLSLFVCSTKQRDSNA